MAVAVAVCGLGETGYFEVMKASFSSIGASELGFAIGGSAASSTALTCGPRLQKGVECRIGTIKKTAFACPPRMKDSKMRLEEHALAQ